MLIALSRNNSIKKARLVLKPLMTTNIILLKCGNKI